MKTTTNNTHATCNVSWCDSPVWKSWSKTLCIHHVWCRDDKDPEQCVVDNCLEERLLDDYVDSSNRLCYNHFMQEQVD